MTGTPTRTLLSLAALLPIAAGCFKLARTSPPVENYVLGGIEASAVSAPLRESAARDSVRSDPPGLSLGIRRLDLAPYLATLAIVVRRADNEIITTGFHRWAEGPVAGLNRAVSGYLAITPGIRSVDVAPWPIGSDHDFLLQLHVTRLEGATPQGSGSRTGEARLLARWEIIRPGNGALVARGVTDYRARDWVVDDYKGLVARLDLGLLRLSKDLVACLTQLAPPTPNVPRAATDTTAASPEPTATIECMAR